LVIRLFGEAPSTKKFVESAVLLFAVCTSPAISKLGVARTYLALLTSFDEAGSMRFKPGKV
jgi:hypothetical protein